MPLLPDPPKSRFYAWDEKLNALLKRFFFFFTPAGIFLDKEKRNWRSLFIWYYSAFLILLLFIWKNPPFLEYLNEYWGISFSLSDWWIALLFAFSPVILYADYRFRTKLIEIQEDARIQKPLVADLIQCLLMVLFAVLAAPAFVLLLVFFHQVLLVDYWVVISFGWSLIFGFVMLIGILGFIAQFFSFKGKLIPSFFFIAKIILIVFFVFLVLAYLLIIIQTVTGWALFGQKPILFRPY